MAMIKNEYKIFRNKTILYITQRNGNKFEVIIDTKDLEIIDKFNHKVFVGYNKRMDDYYALLTEYLGMFNGKPKHKVWTLQRLLTNQTDPKIVVDHKNHKPLDNRRKNLRVTTTDKNSQNKKGANKNNTSGYRNVSYDKRSESWMVQLYVKKKNMIWKGFKTAEDANKHAIKMRKKYYGEFAGES
jgi:hypothetical protein